MHQVTAALSLCTKTPLLVLLAPIQVAFGCASALLADEVCTFTITLALTLTPTLTLTSALLANEVRTLILTLTLALP